MHSNTPLTDKCGVSEIRLEQAQKAQFAQESGPSIQGSHSFYTTFVLPAIPVVSWRFLYDHLTEKEYSGLVDIVLHDIYTKGGQLLHYSPFLEHSSRIVVKENPLSEKNFEQCT